MVSIAFRVLRFYPAGLWLLLLVPVVLFVHASTRLGWLYVFGLPVPGDDSFTYFETFGLVPLHFGHDPLPRWWTSVLAVFVHVGPLHLVFSLVFIRLLGDYVVDALGSLLAVAFFTAAGVCAGMAHAFAFPASTLTLAGSSGAVAAFVAYCALLGMRSHVQLRLPLRDEPVNAPLSILVGAWLLLELFGLALNLASSASSGFPLVPHLAGFLLGVGFALAARVCSLHRPVRSTPASAGIAR